MEQALRPLTGHAILLVMLQLSVLLVVARIGAESVRRLGLPTVVGELAAGILVGPTGFGHYFPGAFATLFPPIAEQYHLLEIISWLGMVLLLLLTGLETDVRLLRHLGRTAIAASVFGMVVPFGFGFGLGWYIPASYVAAPDHRTLFALFLATAMSISAMPVIAKILLDLDLTRRNIGVVILSAGVVDDTTGWIILALIAGAATTGNANLRGLAVSVGGTGLFLLFAGAILFPALRAAFRVATDRFQSKDTDLVLMIVVTLLCAAITDAIGVHAVFGAFVAGCVIKQVPRLRQETLHQLESVTFSIFAPIFFGMVGIKVDLWKLGDFRMLLWVLLVATAGKLVGCTLGSALGGLRFWESVSIAVAMNARGAMELVVASLGLSLGILNESMYSIVVMVAVTTSFMAPVLLRLTMRRVRMTEEEQERILADEARGLFDPEKLRLLVPTAGGDNAFAAWQVGVRVARRSAHPVTLLYVERASSLVDRLMRRFRRTLEGQNLEHHLDRIRGASADLEIFAPEIRREASHDVPETISEEGTKGYGLIMVGASARRTVVRGEKLEKLVANAPCHVGIVSKRGSGEGPFTRILVPVDGSFFSRVAAEFAVRYAEGVGDDASVTVVLVADGEGPAAARTASDPTRARPSSNERAAPGEGTFHRRRADSFILMANDLSREGGLERLSPVFKATKVKTRVLVKHAEADQYPVLTEARSGNYDLVILAAENRAIHHRLFFGYDNERLLEQCPVSVVLLIPKLTVAA